MRSERLAARSRTPSAVRSLLDLNLVFDCLQDAGNGFINRDAVLLVAIAESEADAGVMSLSNRIRDLKKSLGQAS